MSSYSYLLGPLMVAVLASLGCSSTPASEFPSRAELGALTEKPLPSKIFARREAPAEPWELRDPLPDSFDPKQHAGDTAWDRALRGLAATRGGEVVSSEALHCVAEHAARYLSEKSDLPPRALQRFIAARCGAPSAAFETASRWIDVGTGDDDPGLATLAQGASKLVAEVMHPGKQDVGVAMVRGERRAAAVAVALEHRVSLQALSFVPDADGKILVRGQLLVAGHRVRGFVNRGAFGFARCAARPEVRLPAFEMTCEPLATDTQAAVQVMVFPPNRILGSAVVDTIVFPAGAPTNTFTPPDRAAGPPPTPQAIVDALNAKRTEATLAPVALDTPQTGVVAKVTPYFFASDYGEATEGDAVRDKISLGVMAGWDVQGPVSTGQCNALIAPSGASAAELVDSVLDSPSTRASLFEPRVRRVAVGLLRDPNATAALFGAYELVDPSKHADETKQLIKRIAAARGARSLSAMVVLPALRPHVAKAAHELEQGKTDQDVLADLGSASVEALGVGVRTFCAFASSIEDLELPDEIVARPDLRMAIAVGHHRAEGQPWTSLAAVVVLVDGAPALNRMARGRKAPRDPARF